MNKDLGYYDGLPWRVIIDPERQEDGQIIFMASHPDFDGVLGTGETPEAALADLHAARRSMIDALLTAGYPITEPAVVPCVAGCWGISAILVGMMAWGTTLCSQQWQEVCG